MLHDDYLLAILNNPAQSEMPYFKKILEILSTGERDDVDVEKGLLFSFPELNTGDRTGTKKARSYVYKLEEVEVIALLKRKNERDFRPTFSWKITNDDEYLKQKAMKMQIDLIEDIKNRFSSNDYIFYCEELCSSKLYTFDQMSDLDGKCVCHGRLVPLNDDQKKASITKFVNMMPGFLDKEKVLSDIFSKVFPNERIPVETIERVKPRVPKPKKIEETPAPRKKSPVQKIPAVVPRSIESIDMVSMLEWIRPVPSNGHLHLVFVETSRMEE